MSGQHRWSPEHVTELPTSWNWIWGGYMLLSMAMCCGESCGGKMPPPTPPTPPLGGGICFSTELGTCNRKIVLDKDHIWLTFELAAFLKLTGIYLKDNVKSYCAQYLEDKKKCYRGHMMRFQVLLSLWSVTSWLCIDKIPEVAKTKVSKPKRYSLSNLRFCHAPLKRLIQIHPHMSTSRCGNICIRRGFSNRSSVEAAVSGRSCEQQRILWTTVLWT